MDDKVKKLKEEVETLKSKLSKKPIPEKMMRSHENMEFVRG